MNKAINQNIHVDQIGYRPGDKKTVIINGNGGAFSVIDEKSESVVFAGKAEGGAFDAISGDKVFHGDFTGLDKPGVYYVSMPEFGRSYSFRVDNNIYRDVKNAMLKALYFQRCGPALEEKYAGPWKHAACHLKDAHIYGREGETLNGAGGWHDAGDYGKYTVPGALAAAYLLLAYDFFPDAFTEEINIPESGNGIPDILNEARYELEWLLKMQDRSAGGVYHKLTSMVFPDKLEEDGIATMPEDDALEWFFFAVSSPATADFAAVMALASRIYGRFDGKFANRCLEAAEKAWNWLSENREHVVFTNPPGVITGLYGDDSDRDERYWAAAELYRTTGKEEYHEYFIASHKEDEIEEGLMWRHVGGFGNIAYLFTDTDKVNPVIHEEIKGRLTDMAREFTNMSREDGYRLSLPAAGYIWGSNMVVMNVALYLIVANLVERDTEFIRAAQDHLHYLLGRNALNQCYVTGAGSKPIRRPHHRPSAGDGVDEPVPGLVSGGPNSALQGELTRSRLEGNPPARCFIDHVQSFSTNEITVYWNTPAVFAAGFFDSKESHYDSL